MTNAQMHHPERGTTLVELLVGLAILVVLTGLAIPGVMSLWRSYNVRAAADEVIQAVDFARTQAQANRKAYVITLGGMANGNALVFDVWAAPTTACATWATGQKIRSVNYNPNNAKNLATVQVSQFAPLDLANAAAHLCVKPDGRVLRADLSMPYSPPTGSTLGAGDVVLELARIDDNAVLGTPVQVQIGYNGTARVVVGRPIDQLLGSGSGGTP
jgi:Tfp pilus assembly protein FimT